MASLQSASTDRRWHVARYLAYEDRRAIATIRGAGFEAFHPREEVLRSHKEPLIRPLFPGYLLLRFNTDADAWGPLLRDGSGLRNILCSAQNRPLDLLDKEVDKLIAEHLGGMDGFKPAKPAPVVMMTPAKRKFMALVDAEDALAGLLRTLAAPRTLAEQLDRDNPAIAAASAP